METIFTDILVEVISQLVFTALIVFVKAIWNYFTRK